MNSGHVDFSNVDFEKFKREMDDKVAQSKETDCQQPVLPKYIEGVHQAYSQVSHGKSKQGFVLKEGCHGLPFIDSMQMDFKNSKFIVMVRDPRDAFSSIKSISKLRREKTQFKSFSGNNLSLFSFLFHQIEKGFLKHMDYFNDTRNSDSVLFVRYEDLVEHTAKEMHRVSRFLGIKFSNNMLEPTTAGNPWKGNASSEEKFDSVVDSRRNKWPELLSKEEVLLIEFFLGKYFHKYNYSKKNTKISKAECVASIRFSHFGSPIIYWKDFFRPYAGILSYIRWAGSVLPLLIKRILM
jgi:hypothetical protein